MNMRNAEIFLNLLQPDTLPNWQSFLRFHHLFYGWCWEDADPIHKLFRYHHVAFLIDNFNEQPVPTNEMIQELEGEGFSSKFPDYERIGFRHEMDRCVGEDDFHVFTMLYEKTVPLPEHIEDLSAPNRFVVVYQIRDAKKAWKQFYVDGNSCPKTVAAIHPQDAMEAIINMIGELVEQTGRQPKYIVTHDPGPWGIEAHFLAEPVEGYYWPRLAGNQGGWRFWLRMVENELRKYPVSTTDNLTDDFLHYAVELINQGQEVPDVILNKINLMVVQNRPTENLFAALKSLLQGNEIAASDSEMICTDPVCSQLLAKQLLRCGIEVPYKVIKAFIAVLNENDLKVFFTYDCSFPISQSDFRFELISSTPSSEDRRRIMGVVEEMYSSGCDVKWFRRPLISDSF